MDKLNKDELFLIAMKLNLKSLIYFSSCSKRIQSKLEIVWACKVREFVFQIPSPSLRDEYISLYQLLQLKSKLNLLENIREIYEFDSIKIVNLRSIPKEIKCLSELEKLIWSQSNLQTVPKEIGYLINLKHLDLKNNLLKTLPKEIGNLINLELLDLQYNNLQEIPEEIGNLINLKKLYLFANRIKKIPKTFRRLINLEEVFLQNNYLKSVYDSLGDLPNLKRMNIHRNLFSVQEELEKFKIS